MLILNTTDKLQLVSSSAATLDVIVSFSINTAGVITFDTQKTAISSATTTDILAVAAGGTVRNANFVNVRNHDATLACDVTIVMDVSGTDYELFKGTLQPNGVMSFTEGIGWFVYPATPSLDMTKYVTADSVHATAATFADVTGLTFPVISGRNYAFLAHLTAICVSSTTGAQIGVGGVAMTYLELNGVSSLVANPTAAATFTSGRATAINTAFAAQTTGDAGNAPHWLSGGFTPSASGTFAIRCTSETTSANGVIIRKGSWARVTQTAN